MESNSSEVMEILDRTGIVELIGVCPNAGRVSLKLECCLSADVDSDNIEQMCDLKVFSLSNIAPHPKQSIGSRKLTSLRGNPLGSIASINLREL